MVVDFHVHPVSLALVQDPRHRKFMQRSAKCLAPESAIELPTKTFARSSRPTLAG